MYIAAVNHTLAGARDHPRRRRGEGCFVGNQPPVEARARAGCTPRRRPMVWTETPVSTRRILRGIAPIPTCFRRLLSKGPRRLSDRQAVRRRSRRPRCKKSCPAYHDEPGLTSSILPSAQARSRLRGCPTACTTSPLRISFVSASRTGVIPCGGASMRSSARADVWLIRTTVAERVRALDVAAPESVLPQAFAAGLDELRFVALEHRSAVAPGQILAA